MVGWVTRSYLCFNDLFHSGFPARPVAVNREWGRHAGGTIAHFKALLLPEMHSIGSGLGGLSEIGDLKGLNLRVQVVALLTLTFLTAFIYISSVCRARLFATFELWRTNRCS